MKTWLVIAMLVLLPTGARADELEARVMVLPVDGEAPAELGALPADIADALAEGAARTTSSVARATASLADTAVIVGCEPTSPACLDAVAAALNVDQLLLARIEASGDGGVTVEVTAVTREGEPVTRTFAIRAASRAEDLAVLEREVPAMLEAGEARAGDDGGDRVPSDAGVGEVRTVDAGTLVAGGDGGGRGARGPWLVSAAGALAVIAGATFWGMAATTQGDIDAAPVNTATDLERLAELEDRARLRATVGNVLVIGGAVTVAAGVTWWLLDRRSRDAGRVSVAPTLLPRGGGVAVGGWW